MAVTINGTTGIDKVQDGTIVTADIADSNITTAKIAADAVTASKLNVGQLSHRNLIINGAMQIYQRGAGTLASGQFGLDRFMFASANLDNLAGTMTKDSDAPDNFSSSLKITVTTAETSIASDEYAYLHQRIEAQNLQGLGYGTSSAKQVTLSFWVKSSVTGTFVVNLYKGDNTGQIHNKTYTINSANTWEYKTVTFSANTLAGGAIDNDNGIGFYVSWHLGAGSNWKGTSSSSGWITYVGSAWADGQDTDAVLTTTNATWQITGVQLEVGSEATPFEHRPYGDELARCQRYYQVLIDNANGQRAVAAGRANSTSSIEFQLPLTVGMRDITSLPQSNMGTIYLYSGGARVNTSGGVISLNDDYLPGSSYVYLRTTGASVSDDRAYTLGGFETNAHLAVDGEL